MYKVLIADDELKVIKLIKALVNWETLGLELVGIAQDGIEAYEKIVTLKPEIVITDIRMPGYDGIELIKKISDIQPETNFIIVSGYQHFDYAHNAIKYGVKDYLLKPLNKEEINQTLQRITDKFNDSSLARTRVQSNVDAIAELKRQALIKGLTHGPQEWMNMSINELNAQYATQFKEGHFQWIALKPDILLEGKSLEVLDVLMRKLETIVTQQLSSLVDELIIMNMRDRLKILINYPPENKKHIRKALQKIIDEGHSLRDMFCQLSITIGLGNAVTQFDALLISQANAEKYLYERLDQGCGRIIESCQSTIGDNPDIEDLIPIEIRKGLINQIEALDPASIYNRVDEIMAILQQISPLQLIEGALQLVEIVIFALKHQTDVSEKIPDHFETLLEMETSRTGVIRRTRATISAGIEHAVEIKQNEANRPIREAQKYIQDNYASALCLEVISSQAGFSPAYFSTLFKKETGYNFLEYVTLIRMKKAKQFLAEGQKGVMEIAYEVGYQDNKHFAKQFKKITGLNPSQYRKLYY